MTVRANINSAMQRNFVSVTSFNALCLHTSEKVLTHTHTHTHTHFTYKVHFTPHPKRARGCAEMSINEGTDTVSLGSIFYTFLSA